MAHFVIRRQAPGADPEYAYGRSRWTSGWTGLLGEARVFNRKSDASNSHQVGDDTEVVPVVLVPLEDVS